jgi:NAD-dependent deacetylase
VKEQLNQARALVASARSIAVLTGAGISAESGLKTFRDHGGLWEEHTIEQVATPEGFARDPKLVWSFYNARRKAAQTARPNAAHLALARLEESHRVTILTQNIDGLHQKSGSRNVVELHGSIWEVRCVGCGALTCRFAIELPILPRCENCGNLLRPHVVWFGEHLDPDILTTAEAVIDECDIFLVIGTSAVVQPAASYPFIAARRGKPVIEVNKEKTPVSAIASLSLIGLAGRLLPKILPA